MIFHSNLNQEKMMGFNAPRQRTCFWGSSYDRGLDILLQLWPKILEEYPDAELHVCYGWELFDAAYKDNPERRAWKHRINDDMERLDGVYHHGRLSKQELYDVMNKSGIWTYPTYFGETCCIVALDCQYRGCVPCVVNYAALKETVQSGVKVDGDAHDPETQDEFVKQLLNLMGDTQLWKQEQEKGIAFASQYTWDHVADAWLDEITSVPQQHS